MLAQQKEEEEEVVEKVAASFLKVRSRSFDACITFGTEKMCTIHWIEKEEKKVFLSYNISLFRFVSLWNKFWHNEIFKMLEKLFIFGIYRWAEFADLETAEKNSCWKILPERRKDFHEKSK